MDNTSNNEIEASQLNFRNIGRSFLIHESYYAKREETRWEGAADEGQGIQALSQFTPLFGDSEMLCRCLARVRDDKKGRLP